MNIAHFLASIPARAVPLAARRLGCAGDSAAVSGTSTVDSPSQFMPGVSSLSSDPSVSVGSGRFGSERYRRIVGSIWRVTIETLTGFPSLKRTFGHVRSSIVSSAAMAVALTSGCVLIPGPAFAQQSSSRSTPNFSSASASTATYRELGQGSVDTLLHGFYHAGGWRTCPLPDCPSVNRDWGVDSLTYTLYLRWQTTHDVTLVPYMSALASTSPLYPAPCKGIAGVLCTWSDAPQWDTVAALREYEVTGNSVTLARAIRAFETVEGERICTSRAIS